MTRMDTPTAVHMTGENGNHSDIHDGNILGLGTKQVTLVVVIPMVESVQRKVEYQEYRAAKPTSARSSATIPASEI
jgi:hypothetical protein